MSKKINMITLDDTNKIMVRKSPTRYALTRLIAMSGIDNRISKGMMTGDASDITERDALSLWDNARCLENPNLIPLLKQRRAYEDLWDEVTTSSGDDSILFL